MNSKPSRFNLTFDDFEDVAEYVSARVRDTGAPHAVYVPDSGQVYCLRADRLSRVEAPVAWLVGVYDTQARVEHLENDLLARQRELRMPRAA